MLYYIMKENLNAYGVCDSIDQLLGLYDFEADPRKFCISFCKIRKEDQSDCGGWRWHKWAHTSESRRHQVVSTFMMSQLSKA